MILYPIFVNGSINVMRKGKNKKEPEKDRGNVFHGKN